MKGIVLAVFACFFLCVPVHICYSQAPITLSYNSMWPAAYGQAKPVLEFAKVIEERTNGRVKINVFHANALTPPVEIYEGVVTGISDIGQACFAYNPGRFPLMYVLDVPGFYQNAIVNALVSNDIYKKYQPKEMADVHVLYIHNHEAGMISTKKPVKKLEDLKGLRLRAVGGSAKIVKALGAIPVGIPAGESYDALKKGVVDGGVTSPNMLQGWKYGEVTDYTVYSPATGYTTGFYVIMNLKKWNSLPPDIQKIFTDVSAGFPERNGTVWGEMEDAGYKFAKERKHQFTQLSPEEEARWVSAVKPVVEEYEQALDTKKIGVKGKDVVSYRDELIKKYAKLYPARTYK
ncbi:MAG: TRAP transporter substrate-binding protein [Syntrophales bacterium LBB04]|nr:TRAP transporter substrate-binding protein [Syntrophales bacterium LBB04]